MTVQPQGAPQPVPPNQQIFIKAPETVDLTKVLTSTGLKTVDQAQFLKTQGKADKENVQLVAISQGDHSVVYLSKAEALKVATNLLGSFASHYKTDDEKIRGCFAFLFQRGEGVSKVEEEYNAITKLKTIKDQIAGAQVNRQNYEDRELKTLPKWEVIEQNLKLKPAEMKQAKELYEKIMKQKIALRPEMADSKRLELLNTYQNDVVALGRLIEPQFDMLERAVIGRPNAIRDKFHKSVSEFLGYCKSIEKFVDMEKAHISSYVSNLHKSKPRSPLAEKNIITQFNLNKSIESSDLSLAKILNKEAKEKAESDVPEMEIVEGYSAYMDREKQIAELVKLHAITPNEAKVLKYQGQYALSRLKEAASQMKPSKDVSRMSETLEKGEVRTQSYAGFKTRRPEKVQAELRSAVASLLVKALVNGDDGAWKTVDKMITDIKDKIDGGANWKTLMPKGDTDPLKLAWEKEKERRRVS